MPKRYICVKELTIEMVEYEGSDTVIGSVNHKVGTVWEKREQSGDYQHLLDNLETFDWIGLSDEHFKNHFKEEM